MSYGSTGRKPAEYASKAAHQYLVNDPSIKEVLSTLEMPSATSRESIANTSHHFQPVKTPITDVFAIDGGYSHVDLISGFPGAQVTFFQFGALHFSLDALFHIEKSRHPNPEDMQRLKNIERIKFVLPTFNTKRRDCASLTDSVRWTLQEFLQNETLGEETSLLDTLAWFIFRKYKAASTPEDERRYHLSRLPGARAGQSTDLSEADMTADFRFKPTDSCPEILLIDVFRLHEVIEENIGAQGICGYITGVVEHLILLHIIRSMMRFQDCLNRALLLLDRPTGFFGNTSRLKEPMQDLVNWLFETENIFMAGIEKSGAFVNHAHLIRDIMPPSSFIILDNDYINEHISPLHEISNRPYASTTYYGHKIIFKTRHNNMYVVSIPVPKLQIAPSLDDIPNLNEILTHIEQLKCDMYENALLPIALANRLVSLSNIPSSKILAKFAKSTIK